MRLTVAGVLLWASTAAAEHKIDTAEYTFSVPDGWVEAKDAADKAHAGMTAAGPGVEVSAVAWSTPEKTPLALALYARGAPTSGDPRKELAAAEEAVKASLAKRMRVSRFQVVEGATRLTSAFEAVQGQTRVRGTAIVAMSADGRVLGWQLVCVFGDGDAAQEETCQAVLGSFSVIHPEKDLRPLKGK